MIAYQVGWLKYLLCMTPVWWGRKHFSSNQWKSESGLWLWGAEGGLYFPERSHYYCPANLWPASGENLPAECLSFLLLSYALLISLWSYHPLCTIAITQEQKTTYTVDVWDKSSFFFSYLLYFTPFCSNIHLFNRSEICYEQVWPHPKRKKKEKIFKHLLQDLYTLNQSPFRIVICNLNVCVYKGPLYIN